MSAIVGARGSEAAAGIPSASVVLVEDDARELRWIEQAGRLRDRLGGVEAITRYKDDEVDEPREDPCVGRAFDRGPVEKWEARRLLEGRHHHAHGLRREVL